MSQIDVAPTLLDACRITPPASFQGRSVMPLLARQVEKWPNEVFIQISESMTGRVLRTPEWVYVVAQPDGKSQASSSQYEEYQLYNLYSDPHELVNLAGRRSEYRHKASRVAARAHRCENLARSSLSTG